MSQTKEGTRNNPNPDLFFYLQKIGVSFIFSCLLALAQPMMGEFTSFSSELLYYTATLVYLRIQAKIPTTSQELCTQHAFNST